MKCDEPKVYGMADPAIDDEYEMVHKWANIERKCRAKAEEYR